MKNYKYLIASLLVVLFSITSCVKDEVFEEVETAVLEGSAVVLNEIMSNNVGDGVDWIEIYNRSTEDIDLGGYKLNDAETVDGGWTIPTGTIVLAGKYIVFEEDTDWDFGGVSSGGEWVSFADADGVPIDKELVPSMSANAGLTWAREIDGDGEWMVSTPTPNASNGSTANAAPIIDASDLTEFDRVYSVNASDADGILTVKLVYIVNDGVTSLDMSLVDGEYKTSVPEANVGDVVRYYIMATDVTGLSTVYPEDGINTPGEFTVVGGVEEVTFSEVETSVGIYEFSFYAKVYYTDQVDELRLYYLLPGEMQDEANGFDDKHKIEVPTPESNGLFKASIPDLAGTTELKYYIRVEYIDGTKTYYPIEEEGGDFDHDLGITWPTVTVGEIPVEPVNGFSDLTIVNEVGADLTYDVKVEYENGIEEVKFYYYINFDNAAFLADSDTYEDANRVSITWAGDLPTADNMYNFVISAADVTTGDEISWYMRAKDGNGDKLYYTFGETEDTFDGDIKDDPLTWHVITKL